MLQRLPPEVAHHLALQRSGTAAALLARATPSSGHDVDLLGQRFTHPIGLAAGFDKNGDHLDALGALGFSHIEVGTVTPRPQPGNPRPRLFRLRGARALINRMGFNNRGAEYVAQQLRRASWRGVRGVSIGKNADTPLERAADDYIACLRKLYPRGGLFRHQRVLAEYRGDCAICRPQTALAGIVEPLHEERQRLAGATRPACAAAGEDLAGSGRGPAEHTLRRASPPRARWRPRWCDRHQLQHRLARLRSRVARPARAAASAVHRWRTKSLEVLRRLRRELGAGFPHHRRRRPHERQRPCSARLAAGANLVQLYTGFVYRGPALLWREPATAGAAALRNHDDPRIRASHRRAAAADAMHALRLSRAACPTPRPSRAARPTSTSARPAAPRPSSRSRRSPGAPLAPLNRDNGIEAAPTVAFIDEERCIGCTKCLPPCPVDAIVGAPRAHAHRHRGALHGLRAVRRALPGRLHRHGAAAREPGARVAGAAAAPTSRARYEAHNERIARRAAERAAIARRQETRRACRHERRHELRQTPRDLRTIPRRQSASDHRARVPDAVRTAGGA